jgi:hypothetical protein
MTSLADRCPACGTENNSPPISPYKISDEGEQLIARYKCPDCRCKWLVCWLVSALQEAA